jgi:hypothetical protein
MVFDWVTGVVFVCSVLHTMLPPWDMLHEFPTAQKYYKVVVYTVGYIAINGRSTVYRELSMGKQVQAVQAGQVQVGQPGQAVNHKTGNI